jgi:hypothetical protein
VHGDVVHFKVAGALVRLAAHVGGALHVVLAAQRIHARRRATDVAGHHGDVGDEHHGARTHGCAR